MRASSFHQHGLEFGSFHEHECHCLSNSATNAAGSVSQAMSAVSPGCSRLRRLRSRPRQGLRLPARRTCDRQSFRHSRSTQHARRDTLPLHVNMATSNALLAGSVPLSLTIMPGLLRCAINSASSRTTRRSDIEASSTDARQSRVTSSTAYRRPMIYSSVSLVRLICPPLPKNQTLVRVDKMDTQRG